MEDTARLLAVKSELIKTTATPGWNYITGLMNNIVTVLVQEALDAKAGEGEEKRLAAKGAQRAFEELQIVIASAKQFEPTTDAEDNFDALNIN